MSVFILVVFICHGTDAVDQIMKLRGVNDYGDLRVRPRITPKINMSATSLIKLIQWKPGQVDEPRLLSDSHSAGTVLIIYLSSLKHARYLMAK